MYPTNYYYKSKGPVTLWNKLNPIWWMGNKDDPITQEKYAGRWSDDALWLRKVKWFFRNPGCNFRRYVIGFWDKQDIWVRQRLRRQDRDDRIGNDDMWPLEGERFAICMPYISFNIGGFKGLLGWKPNGEFGGPQLKRIK
jgi:hypothetical protein